MLSLVSMLLRPSGAISPFWNSFYEVLSFFLRALGAISPFWSSIPEIPLFPPSDFPVWEEFGGRFLQEPPVFQQLLSTSFSHPYVQLTLPSPPPESVS